jgi:hypothetical protein
MPKDLFYLDICKQKYCKFALEINYLDKFRSENYRNKYINLDIVYFILKFAIIFITEWQQK